MIGEIGLDFRFIKDKTTYPAQRNVFETFLLAAKEQKKIINIHTAGAEKEVLQYLIEYEIQKTIIHWYSGPINLISKFVDTGAYFTIGVEILFSILAVMNGSQKKSVCQSY